MTKKSMSKLVRTLSDEGYSNDFIAEAGNLSRYQVGGILAWHHHRNSWGKDTTKVLPCLMTHSKTSKKGHTKTYQSKPYHSLAPVSIARKAAIYALLQMGFSDAEEIRQVMAMAAKPENFSHISVYGCKAAITKAIQDRLF